MVIKLQRVFLLTLLALPACAPVAKGPLYENAKIENAIIVYRPFLRMGAGAGAYTISVNGNEVCKLHTGSFYIIEGAGQKNIASEIWGEPGTSRISITPQKRNIKYVRMDVNPDKQNAILAAGLIGAFVAEGASESSGPFIFTVIESQQAQKELATLRQDCA